MIYSQGFACLFEFLLILKKPIILIDNSDLAYVPDGVAGLALLLHDAYFEFNSITAGG